MLINPWIFYLINVCNTLNIFFSITCIISCAFLAGWLFIFGLIYFDNYGDSDNYDEEIQEVIIVFKRFLKRFLIVFTISFFGMTFIPSESTATKMLIVSQVDETNMERAKEVIDYIIEKVQEVKYGGSH